MNAIFEWLSSGLQASSAIALLAAFGWGIGSVGLSPCHLASVPLAVAFVRRDGHGTALRVSLALSLGVLVSLVLIGAITVLAGRIAGDLWGVGPWVAAVALLVAGLYLLDVLELPVGLKLDPERVPRNSCGAFLVGLLLGVTLGPCTFAFFAPVFAGAFSKASEELLFAVGLVTAFSLGHVLAVTVAGVLGFRVSTWLAKGGAISSVARQAGGVVLLLSAVYLLATTT